MRTSRKEIAGFTLVELLVVIAIIGVLIALLLPAVQAAREAARRTSCSVNLKQISLALLTYESTYKEFPHGVYSAPFGTDKEDGLGWATRILPDIEQQQVFDLLAHNNIPGYTDDPWKGGVFRAARAAGMTPIAGGDTVIPTFLCPSADLPLRVPTGDYFGAKSAVTLANTGYGTSSYKASRGYCDRGMYWRTEEGLKTTSCAVDYDGDGQLETIKKGAYTSIRMSDVADGTSHTIGIGEAAYFAAAKSFPIWMGSSYNEDGAVLFKTEDVINCNLGGPRQFPLSQADLNRLPGGKKADQDDCTYSWHTGGAFFGFVDGSVHFLTENFSLRIFYLLGDRIDNIPIPNTD